MNTDKNSMVTILIIIDLLANFHSRSFFIDHLVIIY